MITKEKAQEIVEARINEPDPYWPKKPRMVVVETEEKEIGWLFRWTSKVYLESQDINDAIAGNGPILVARANGNFEEIGSASPMKERIEEAEEKLKRRLEPSH